MEKKFRSEIAEIVGGIESVRSNLEDLVLTMANPPSEWAWYEYSMERPLVVLEYALSNAAKSDSELRTIIYRRMLGAINSTSESLSQPKAASHFNNPKLRKAFDFIKRKGPIKGTLVASHIDVSEPGFRSRYVPKLKEMGVRNEGDGYYIPEPPTEPTGKSSLA